MQNQYLLEELRLLQQRRQQQQQDLLQQQMQQLPGSLFAAAAAAPKPFPSGLLESLNLAGLGGAPASGPPGSAPGNPSTNNDLLLLQIQQQLHGGGNAIGGTPAAAVSNLLGTAGSSFSPALSSAINPLAMSNEDLLRTVLLGQATQNTASQAQPAPQAAAASLPSLLNSIVADRMREAEAAAAVATKQEEGGQLSKRQRIDDSATASRSPPPPAAMQQGHLQGASAVDVLASAAAEMALKQASVSVASTKSTSFRPIRTGAPSRGNRFPLPSGDANDKSRSGFLGMPKLSSFHEAWGNVKTKAMQKEIFLRKLHGGKMLLPPPPAPSASPPDGGNAASNPSTVEESVTKYQAV